MKNKCFMIICITLLCILLFTNNVFANFDIVLDDIKYSYPDIPEPSSNFSKNRFIILEDQYHDVYLCFISTNFSDEIIWSGKTLKYSNYNESYSFSTYIYRDNWRYCFDRAKHTNANFKFLYSTENIYSANGDIYFKKSVSSVEYSINLSTNNITNAPLIAYSNYFNYSDARKYECYISTDAKSWTLMNYETFNDTVNNIIKFRFNYKIYQNGCYYFKFLNKETNEDYYLSYNITNIVKNSSNSGFTDSGIPQPFCTYERVNDEFVIKTQSFSADDMQKFRCFYTIAPGKDYSSWDEMSMGSLNNESTGETEYYFFFTVPKNSEDCTYYFVFYDNNLKQFGSPSSMNCYFDKMNEYADSLNPTVSKKNSRFNDLLKYFKERFGFLTYPFEFLVNFANRIFNINYSEPVIHIPELREPFNNDIIFNGLDFNFNSLLNNDTFSYIYNIYLVAVDFIIVVLFIFLCKKEIEEVFGNG